MSSLQEQARALGDPSRHRIFRFVADAGHPVGVAELTAEVGLNHNAVRQHLAKLVAAGLLTEGRARASGPGRPRLEYEPSTTADSRWGVTGPYERLSRMLATVIRSGSSPEEVGVDEGRRRASRSHDADVGEVLCDAMARDGFDPELEPTDSGVDVVLRRCPFESTAVADPDTVCALHLGMARGLTEHLDGVDVLELVARDPRVADCRLRVRVAGPPPRARHPTDT